MAGGMERTDKLPKIKDEEREQMFGYVYGVSGPGKSILHVLEEWSFFFWGSIFLTYSNK